MKQKYNEIYDVETKYMTAVALGGEIWKQTIIRFLYNTWSNVLVEDRLH